MVYLDYSATTPVNYEVLDSFIKCSKEYIGNPNSLHELGIKSNNIIESATRQIANLLNVNANEIIYTSGASESNNLAIKGICDKYKNRGKHIVTTPFEHSSIYGPLDYLKENGYEIDFVKVDESGLVDLNNLKDLLREDTILVSICAVNSEIGIRQPIEEIAKIIKCYPRCIFHSDMTQAIGKTNIDIKDVDLISFSAHKFYGIKGIGVLIKKEKVELTPLIHGGKSTTVYRSGTPTVSHIISISKALRLALTDITKKYEYVENLNNYIKENLKSYNKIKINSNDKCIPHILNISILGVKPETFQHALEKYEIYVSTQSACSETNSKSKSVLALTNDMDKATSSIRISLSHLTSKEDIDYFIDKLKVCYEELTNLR